jgi:hypothetical protein
MERGDERGMSKRPDLNELDVPEWAEPSFQRAARVCSRVLLRPCCAHLRSCHSVRGYRSDWGGYYAVGGSAAICYVEFAHLGLDGVGRSAR